MDKELYFGVDVSKKTLDLAYYDGETIDWKNAHIKVSNDDAGFKKIGSWVAKVGKDFDTFLFCLEYTGLYNQNFRLWLESKEYIYSMVEPRKMHRFEPDLDDDQRSLDRIKTDELDAFRIAIYCEQNHKKILRNPSKLPSPVYFKLKRLLAERKQNTKQSVLYKQQLHDICAYDTDLSVERKKLLLKNMKENQKAIDKEIDSYMNEDASISKNFNLLSSIPGIGRIIALETIVLTENFTAISNPRKYACYIGIAPFKKESGTSVRKRTAVSKKGFSEAKSDLSIAALSAITYNPAIRGYWIRKKKEKCGGIVLNAIKFKLVLRMFADVSSTSILSTAFHPLSCAAEKLHGYFIRFLAFLWYIAFFLGESFSHFFFSFGFKNTPGSSKFFLSLRNVCTEF